MAVKILQMVLKRAMASKSGVMSFWILKAPENPTFTQRNLQKIDYFKRLIDNLIYTKANRRLTK
jgi:hypothetical protein